MFYVGWVGTILAISASIFISIGLIKKEHWFFSVSMFVASIIFIISSLMIENIQSAISNGFFVLSSILAMFGIVFKFKFVSLKNMIILSLIGFIVSAIYYIQNYNPIWLFQSLGWVPVFTLPFTFMLFTQSKITDKQYFSCNIITHSVFFVHLVAVHNYPIAVLQIVCFVIALIGLLRVLNSVDTVKENIA